MSLVEQKRLQWAREREEMVGLCGLWGSDTTRPRADHIGVPAGPARRALSVHHEAYPEEGGAVHAVHVTLQRRPSLPPIRRPSQPQPPQGPQRQGDRDSTPEEAGSGGHTAVPDGYHASYQVAYADGYPAGYPRAYPEEESSGYASDTAAGPDQVLWEEAVSQQLHRHVPAAAHGDWQERPGAQPAAPGSAASHDRRGQHGGRYVLRGGWTAQQPHGEAARPTGTAGSGSSASSSSWADDQHGLRGLQGARGRWGDRGVGVGHLWEPCEDGDGGPNRLPPVLLRGGAPAWMHRGLRGMDATSSEVTSQVLVVSHPDSPGEQGSPPGTGGTGGSGCGELDDSVCRSFLRGQNVPLEADILEERARRRAKALEHQAAIRKQLEERDRRRKEERERRLREERREEERLRREQEEQRRRLESERRQQRDKEEQEARRAAAMLEALQTAEREAKESKSKQSRKHVGAEAEVAAPAEAGKGQPSPRASPRTSPRVSPRTTPRVSPRTSPKKSPRSAGPAGDVGEVRQESPPVGPPCAEVPVPVPAPASASDAAADGPGQPAVAARRPGPADAAELAERLSSMHVAESAMASQDGERAGRLDTPGHPAARSPPQYQVPDTGRVPPSTGTGLIGEPATGWFPILEFLPPPAPGLPHEYKSAGPPPLLPLGDGLALVMPHALGSGDSGNGSSVHSCGHGGHGTRVIATPQQMALLMSPMSLASAKQPPTTTGGHPRLLTPTKFRRRLREVATQTSAGLRRRGGGAGSGRSRLGAHGRPAVGDRERPKWGVNRPGTMYRTQSEKDPNYHQQRLQRLQRLQQRMLRHLRSGGSGTTTASSNSGGAGGGPRQDGDGSGSPTLSSPRGSPGSGDMLSRTYRICRADETVSTSSTSSTCRRHPGQQQQPPPAPGSRQGLRHGLQDHLYRLAAAASREGDSPPLTGRRGAASSRSSRPGRYSVREDSGGSSGASPRGSPGEEDRVEAGESLTEEDLLTRLREGLLRRRDRLEHDLGATSPSPA